MKRFFKRLLSMVMMVVIAFGMATFGPNLFVRFFGERSTQWIRQRFSETLREKSELVVYEVEIEGQETVSQNAWLLGTVQKVEMPYTFQMRFTVDLNRVKISAHENVIEVRLPAPVPGYQKLTVDEDRVQKTDWLYRLTPERYAQIKNEVEQKLFEECSQNPRYTEEAWNTAVRDLQSLFQSVTAESLLGKAYEIQIVQDNSVTAE